MSAVPEFVREEIDRFQAWKQRIALKRKYIGLFESPDGREVLHDILRAGNFASNCFNQDPHIAAYNEGKRALALHILSRMRLTGDEAQLKLMEEGYER